METHAEKFSEVRLGSCFPMTSHHEIFLARELSWEGALSVYLVDSA